MVSLVRFPSRARRVFPLLLAICLVFSGWLLPAPRPALAQANTDDPDPTWLSFKPAADVQVAPALSAAAAPPGRLQVGRQPAALGLLRFEVSGVGASTVRRATLRVYAYDASPAGYIVQALGAAPWPETVPARRKPPPGRVLGVSGTHFAGELTQVDLTGYIVADGVYSLGLTTISDQSLAYAGRAMPGYEPRLFLELGEPVVAATPTAPPAATAADAATSTPATPAAGDVSACEVNNLAWTVTGRLLRGGRPSEAGLRCLAAAGVDVLVDQRTPAEAGAGFAAQAQQAGLEYINLGVPDDTAPSPGVLSQWLATVNEQLAQGRVVLIHDAGGRGRMGFWDAFYRMLYGGLSPPAAIDGYYVGTALPFQGAKIDCANGGQGQVQALAEIAQALTGQPYYPSVDEYGSGWTDCPRPAYMEGWDYAALF